MSLTSTLVTDVSNILRRANLDSRILDWIGMAYNDATSRYPTYVTVQQGAGTIAASNLSGAWLGGYNLSNPIVAIFVDSDSKYYFPNYVPMTDFSVYRRDMDMASPVSGSPPVVWSYGPAPRVNTTLGNSFGGSGYLYVYPAAPTGGYTVYILYHGQTVDGPPTPTTVLKWPSHFDDVLVWGAAYYGAMVVNRQIVGICKEMYEQALRRMALILTYKPDALPQKRSAVDNPYMGITVPQMARFPDTLGG